MQKLGKYIYNIYCFSRADIKGYVILRSAYGLKSVSTPQNRHPGWTAG